jgi:hypothetical protein
LFHSDIILIKIHSVKIAEEEQVDLSSLISSDVNVPSGSVGLVASIEKTIVTTHTVSRIIVGMTSCGYLLIFEAITEQYRYDDGCGSDHDVRLVIGHITQSLELVELIRNIVSIPR